MMDARARPRTPACAPPRGMQSQPSFQLLLLGRFVSQKQPRGGSSAPSPTRLLSSLSLSPPLPSNSVPPRQATGDKLRRKGLGRSHALRPSVSVRSWWEIYTSGVW